MPEVVLEAMIAIGSAGVVGGIGAFLARRYGMPGLARDVEAQQERLNATYLAELTELRAQHAVDEHELAKMRDRMGDCHEQLRTMRRQLVLTESDLAALIREHGRTPPAHLTEHTPDA